MGNNYQSQTMVLKNTALYRFITGVPLIKKVARVLLTVFCPWIIIWKQKTAINDFYVENEMLSDSVNFLKGGGSSSLLVDKSTSTRVPLDEVAGMLHWPELLDDADRKNGFSELVRLFALVSEESVASHPSNCWVLLAAKNCDQLLKHGYDNFKRTIGHNYFNFLVQQGDVQIKAAESLHSSDVLEKCRQAALSMPDEASFSAKDQFSYKYFVFLLWEYVKQLDTKHYLDKLEEPKEGNPILVHANGKSMSQDLANSLIEYYSIDTAVPVENCKTILEIGSGYGRNAHVTLSLNPNAKVVLVDILPALYIAQRYLSSIFPDKKIFVAKYFSSYEVVKDEIAAADIVFLLPNQLEKLPDDYFDLTLNISSFGEMSLAQIKWYFDQIHRVTSQYFYMKQWNVSKNPFDGLELTKADYPYLESWEQIYSRDCVIQTEFFETLFKVKK